MECPNTYQPKLDESGEFWKKVQTTCLQAFSSVRWNPGESHWYSPTCKSHTFQAILRRALSKEGSNLELTAVMKRRSEVEQVGLYAFSIDTALKYQLTPGERDFLRKLHLEDFITSVPWGVLHTQLVTEAIAALEPDTWVTTVKGESVPLIAENWREQFQHDFHLTLKEAQPVTTKWQLTDLFPTLKENSEGKETVRISDCQHPGARRPLRLLSSLFCLNPTHQSHITMSFVEFVVSALNGQEVDWPQEFYHEITEEILALHNKHLAAKVKVEKTSIGPHLTLILKARGILNIKEELEAGYRTDRALTLEEQLPNPKKKKTKEAEELGETQTTIRLVPPPPKNPAKGLDPQITTHAYSIAPQPITTPPELPQRGVILETLEKRQPPNTLPAMVEQICQAHRRLENLLFSFTSKAPQTLVNRMSDEFFKIQREATLQESLGKPANTCAEVLLRFQEVQLKHLTQQLSNSDSLNDINIEAMFHLEEKSVALRKRLEQAEEEVLSLRGQKGEVLEQLSKLQTKIDNQAEKLQDKDTEISHLTDRVTELKGILKRQDDLATHKKSEMLKLESQAASNQQEIAHLRAENHKLKAEISAGEEKTHLHRFTPEQDTEPLHPILNKEIHTLTAGVANKLLNQLRRDLAQTQQEKIDLAHRLIKQQ